MCWHHHTCVTLSTGGLDFEMDTELLTIRPPRHRCCHQELTGSLWGMQFSFSLDVSSDIYVLLRAWRPCRATVLSGQSIVYACIWQMMLSFYAHYDGTLHSALELTNVWVSSWIQLYHQCVSSFMYTVVPRYNTVVGSMKWNRVIHGAWYSILC